MLESKGFEYVLVEIVMELETSDSFDKNTGPIIVNLILLVFFHEINIS